jgi:hypothetical protein
MSNGDSLDGFVFPPFIPTASTRPAQTPPPVPQQPAPEPADASGGRMVMPWDLETPIVRQPDEPAAQPEAAQAGDDDEDLPWLEVPAPREADAPAAEAPSAPASDDAFPDWLAWDQRDETAAEADARDTVAPIAGLEDFVPVDDLGYVAPPAAEWAEAAPAEFAEAPPTFDAVPPPLPAAAEPEAGFPEFILDDAPSAPAPAAPSSEDWSLSTPEAAEPPPVTEVPLPTWEESPAAAEPSFEISVDEADAGVIDIEPAASAEPSAAADPFVADAEAVIASEPAPGEAPEEPAPFTAASVTEAAAPVESADAGSPFDDVAERLEQIARMLRDRPDELLAGGSPDPLALLVTGYVMGYTARGGR